MKKKIGFIGLGVMGLPMCRNLLKAGYPVVAYDIRDEITKAIAKDGAEVGTSASDVAGKVDVIITVLPDGPDVKDVVLGPKGLLEGARPGSILIDMSSISPTVSKEVAEAAKAKGVRMLDAPVSGGEPGAISGLCRSWLAAASQTSMSVWTCSRYGQVGSPVGDIGAGNTTKLCNQIIVAANIAAVGKPLR